MDKTIRDTAKLNHVVLESHLDVEEFQKFNESLTIDGAQFRFEILDHGHASIVDTAMQTFLENTPGNLLIVMNRRWMAVKKKDGMFYCFNCHATKSDGTYDLSDKDPAVVVRTMNAEEATRIVKLFGVASEAPNGIVVMHSIVFHPMN